MTKNPIFNRSGLLQLAKLAEYNDNFVLMASSMRRIIEHDHQLSSVERVMFYDAYTNLVTISRNDLINSMLFAHNLPIQTKEVLEKKRTVLRDACSEPLALINILMEHADSAGAKVFYLIMKGHILQSLIDGTVEEEQKYVKEDIVNAYKEASEITKSEMLPTNPFRLEVALTTAEFYSGICESPKKALELLRQTLSEVEAEPEQYVGECAHKTPELLQLIKKKLEHWTSHMQDANMEETDGVNQLK